MTALNISRGAAEKSNKDNAKRKKEKLKKKGKASDMTQCVQATPSEELSCRVYHHIHEMRWCVDFAERGRSNKCGQ